MGFEVTDQNGRIHSQVAELLSAYIDDEVSGGERALVEAHLATCTACAQDLTTLGQTVALLGELPQVTAPRPFTLRESDVRPARDTTRPAWWRLPWAQGLVGAAAVLLCVVVVGGVVLLGRGGMVGAPAAPVPLAMEARPSADEAANEQMVAEKVVEEAEAVVEVEEEVEQEVQSAAPPPLAAEEATAELGMAMEAPAEAAPVEEKMAADEGEALMATPPARAASGAVPALSATPAPMATATAAPTPTKMPAPAAEALPAAPSPTPALLEVEDLSLEIDPGVIRVRGRSPLPESRKLLAVLWRNGQPIEWATLESRRLVVEADGQFYLVLIAQADVPYLDLFAAEPAYYEIRIRPVDPPAPVEIRIPFDTYGPPPSESTSTP
jgi:anti-sigma factor RsiW